MLPSWASHRARNAVIRRGAHAEREASVSGLTADVISTPTFAHLADRWERFVPS